MAFLSTEEVRTRKHVSCSSISNSFLHSLFHSLLPLACVDTGTALSLAHTLSRSPPSLRPRTVPPVPKPDLLARDAKVLGERHARTSARRELGHRFKELLEEKLLLAQDDPARRCHGRTAHPFGRRPFVVVLLAGLLVVRLVLLLSRERAH